MNVTKMVKTMFKIFSWLCLFNNWKLQWFYLNSCSNTTLVVTESVEQKVSHLQSTCNNFASQDISSQWQTLERLYTNYDLQIKLGPLIGISVNIHVYHCILINCMTIGTACAIWGILLWSRKACICNSNNGIMYWLQIYSVNDDAILTALTLVKHIDRNKNSTVKDSNF